MESWIKKQHFGKFPIDFEELEYVIGELVEEIIDAEKIDHQKPVQLTFNLKFDKDKNIHIENIGNKFSVKSQKQIVKAENLSDISESPRYVVLTMELPFTNENEFSLTVFENKLVVVSKNQKNFRKEFLLMSNVEPKIVKTIFKNGILEVILKKKSL